MGHEPVLMKNIKSLGIELYLIKSSSKYRQAYSSCADQCAGKYKERDQGVLFNHLTLCFGFHK